MGEANFLPARIIGAADGEVRVETALGEVLLPAAAFAAAVPPAGGRITLCIRPEHFRPAGGAEASVALGRASIIDSAFFGGHHRCHLRPEAAPDMILTAHLPQTAQPRTGDLIDLAVAAASVVALAEAPASTQGDPQ
nr:TOBE domain-containing protein [Hoeflea marina]